MTDTHSLEELSSDLVVAAARVVRAVRRQIEQPAGVRVLSLIDEFGSLGVTRLAALDRCAQATMSGTVAALEREGWVARESDAADARRSLITLTPQGRQALHDVRRANGRAVAARLTRHTTHTADDLATAVAVLRDLIDTDIEGTTL